VRGVKAPRASQKGECGVRPPNPITMARAGRAGNSEGWKTAVWPSM
jgi:hypothetical protein